MWFNKILLLLLLLLLERIKRRQTDSIVVAYSAHCTATSALDLDDSRQEPEAISATS